MTHIPSFTILCADRLFDGTGNATAQSAAILIEDGTVRAIGRQAAVKGRMVRPSPS